MMPPVMSATCSAICSSPAYAAELKASGGHTVDETYEYAGRTYTHNDIAAAVEQSYLRHRGAFTVPEGASKHVTNRTKRQFKNAVAADVKTTFGVSGWTIALGLAVLFFSGPFGLVMAVIAVVFEHYFSRDLWGDQAIAAMAAAV